MRFFALTAVASLLSAVSAANITVVVGKDGGLTYTPNSVTANVGDVVAFQFVSKNHTVTQSTFTAPCTPKTNPAGVNSGFQPVAAGATSFPQWSFTVQNASAPMWFYCEQVGHCSQGMVFALNPSADKTFAAFQAAALASASNGTSGGYGYPGGTGSTTGSGSTKGSGTATASGSASSASTKPASGAMVVGGKAAAFLTIAGLVAGLNL